MDLSTQPSFCSADFLLHKEEYLQRSTFSHWQLKDLLCCPGDCDVVFFADCMVIKSLNTGTGEVIDQLELSYPPTALTVAHGYICAVGPDSELTVKALETGQLLFTGKCGTTISNSCVIRRHGPNDVRLMVCLNEHRVKVHALPAMTSVADVSVGTQVNHCSVSPDGKMLVAVGDSHFIYTYDINGTDYVPKKEFKAFEDCCFSCCFSPDGHHFIAAAQDGMIVFMKVHNGSLVPTLTMYGLHVRSSPAQATKYCRAIKYHPTPGIDLVAFSESTSHIHVLDVWAPDNHQVVRLAPENEETDICGLCFSPDGRYLYVALQDRLVRLTVDLPSRRCRPYGALM